MVGHQWVFSCQRCFVFSTFGACTDIMDMLLGGNVKCSCNLNYGFCV